ncbi:MAG: hypothetical protein LBB98_04690 [Treponema sp.]|jgi:hypothetical protein|nr:hypothetical protein [Treponema sp.]
MVFRKAGIKAIILCIFAGIATPAFAYTVSFIVVETGQVQDGPGSEASHLWENELMDVFFNAGHIVSNAHTLRINSNTLKDFPDEAQGDFDEARQGGADFFVMALLNYQPPGEVPESSGTAVRPRQIFLKVFRVNPCQKVYEQEYSGSAGDESVRAKNAARASLSHLRER